MKIGIEAQRIFRKKKHGMDMVALELIKALQANNTSHHFLVFAQADEDMQCLQNGNGVEIVLLPNAPYPIWEQWYLPKAAKQHQVDLLHCTSNTAPVFLSVPLIITLHDIIYLEKISLSQGTAYQIFGNIYRKWIVPIIAKKAVKIITVSNFENKRILNYFGFNKNLVQTIYNAAGSNFKRVFDPNLLAETRKKYKLPDSFIFFIGNTDPKKNVIGVLKALSILKKANNLPCKLVMLDIDKNYLQNKANEIGDPNIVEDILFTGYVPNNELPAIYSLASIFLYPSLRESFGIPLVEAMCCEVPVITSNTSSMPEIVGDAALICDPYDEIAIAKAINELLNNNDLLQNLRLKGKIQSNYFSWEKNASDTLKIYQSIVSNENEF